jgi:hypothetical protein
MPKAELTLLQLDCRNLKAALMLIAGTACWQLAELTLVASATAIL